MASIAKAWGSIYLFSVGIFWDTLHFKMIESRLSSVPIVSVILLSAPFIGSFFANLVVRLPAGQGIIFGRSVCVSCTETIASYDLVPILSWLVLFGRCRACGNGISRFYPLFELAVLGIAIWSVSVMSGWIIVVGFFLGTALLALALIDVQHLWLPDILTLPLIPAGLIVTWLGQPAEFTAHLIGAGVGFAGFYGIAKLYRWFRGQEGLGMGDAKLLAGIGAFVSWSYLPAVIGTASVVALIFVACRHLLLCRPIAAQEKIAFGPFLAAAGWLVWLYSSSGSSALG